MADDPNKTPADAPSLDPRTWVGVANQAKSSETPAFVAAHASEAAVDGSFDPRSWRRGEDAASAPSAPLLGRKSPSGAAVPWVVGGAALILIAGGGWWIMARGKPPVPAATSASTAGTGALAPQAVTAAPAPAATPTTATALGAAHRTLTLAGTREIADALSSSGVPPADAQAAARAASAELGSNPGELRVVMDLASAGSGTALTRLEARRPDGSGVVVERDQGGGWAAKRASTDVKLEVKVVRGEMDATSFYSSAVAAGVNDRLIPEFAQAFAFDFDFQREIKAGDVFEAAFELPKDGSGQVVGPERLLFVSLETAAKSRALYRYTAQGEKESGWFDSNGRSVVRSLMRTPVEGARVSSTFGMRVHPVLGFSKMHNGTDFAAPVGTPIYAAGDAAVKWAAMKGPNGNLTILTHDNGWETYYLHQNAFAPGVTAGARVRQGQTIGWIGTTGRSTGPHLHYEVHIESKPVDPSTIQVAAGRSLAGAGLSAFNKERDRIDELRAAQTR